MRVQDLERSQRLSHARSIPCSSKYLRSWAKSDEELRSVGVGTGIGHGKRSLSGVLEARDELVFELLAVDGGTAAAGTGWVTSLDHESEDNVSHSGDEKLALRPFPYPLMMRWKITLSYLPVEAKVAKFLQVRGVSFP